MLFLRSTHRSSSYNDGTFTSCCKHAHDSSGYLENLKNLLAGIVSVIALQRAFIEIRCIVLKGSVICKCINVVYLFIEMI